MKMTKGFPRIILLLTFILACVSVDAQTGAAYGAYSPYSVFGIGDIAKEGTAYNRSMGGVGIANRNRRFINITNPAAISSIDSSSFMADFGLSEGNTVYRQNLDGARALRQQIVSCTGWDELDAILERHFSDTSN